MSDAIAVLGAGSWGTALALQLARSDLQVRLWGHDPAHVERLSADRENLEFLPGFALPDNIHPQASLQAAIADCRFLLVAIPSKAFRTLLQQLKPLLDDEVALFWASKGFEIETGLLLHEVIDEELPGRRYGIVSGPTFATEVARNLPAAVTCAGSHADSTLEYAELLHGGHFRCYTSSDVIGVEIGGALKNVLAIAVGAVDGLGLGSNTRAALITRGLAEIMRFSETMGGHKETLMGLSGLGDLILTSTDNQSRNRRFGLAVGQGQNIDQAIESIGQTVEGYRAARAVYSIARQHGLSLPIIEQVYLVLYQGKSIADAVNDLEKRELKPEVEQVG